MVIFWCLFIAAIRKIKLKQVLYVLGLNVVDYTTKKASKPSCEYHIQ